MLPKERLQIISQIATEENTVYVSELSKKLNVSEETIRRDLEKLEAQEILIRSHGGAVLNPEKAYSQHLLMRIPEQYETNSPTVYGKIMAVLDYISGMTDIYALDLYRKITGMSIPTL